jgi:hypothetical protein
VPRLLPAILLSVGCSTSGNVPQTGDASVEASADAKSSVMDRSTDVGRVHEAESSTGSLTPCPVSGPGAFVLPGTTCVQVTPAQTGANASGQNATVPSYAVTPEADAGTRDELLVWLNGSGEAPGGSEVLMDPTLNFYAAAASLGYSVLGPSYTSAASIASLCGENDACYFATRKSIVLGVPQAGAAPALATITLDEGIVDRVVLALRYLEAHDPARGWGAFLVSSDATVSPEDAILWSKVAVAGHSQGGGHAAVVGKLLSVARVIQLSAPCDNVNGTPASWTAAGDGPWASDPAQFFGFATPTMFTSGKPTAGDLTCPYHLAAWENLGMVVSHQEDDAATCGVSGDTHPESIRCTENYAAWVGLLR